MISVNPTIVAFITSPILVPILTSLLSKAGISNKVKLAMVAVVSLVVAAFASFIVPDTGYAVFSWESVSNYVITFLLAGQGYDKFWKPILNINAHALPNAGVGTVIDTTATDELPPQDPPEGD